MSEKATFRLVHAKSRELALQAVTKAEDGSVVTVGPPTRNLEQNAKLHALLADIVKSGFEFRGYKWDITDWKCILVSAHGIETKAPAANVVGLNGELVQLGERTSEMSVARMTSLIEFIQAFIDQNGIARRDA